MGRLPRQLPFLPGKAERPAPNTTTTDPKGSRTAMFEINQTESKRGGARKGAGRKKGSATKKTREIADRAAEQGITPLEVMLGAMRDFWESGDKEKAAGFAKDAAPYMHPRLTAVEHTGTDGGAIKTDSVWRVEFVTK